MAKKKVTYWFGADITEFEKKVKQIEYSAKRMSYSTARLGKIMSKNITAPIVGIGALAIRESIAFESAFAKVKKTVIGTEEQLKKLERGILEMSTVMPTSAKEIAEVAASAGQLGIETENVLGFAKAMIQLGETSNMSADEAADALARFSNITGMSQKDFDRLGSTVVALGNSLATTEREVVNMGLGLAGAGSQIGMTEPEILAFAGSLSSVGIEAERGGSAFSRLMMNMKLATVNGGQALNDFASIAGMTASQFKNQFEKDASGAIIKFIQGLAGLKGTGTSAIEVLDKMGIKEIRLRDSILRATGASEMFTQALALGRKEWEQNSAMQQKTAEFYKTTEAQLKILRNQVYLTGKEIGDTLTPSLVIAAEKLRDVVKAFSDLSPELKTNIVEWGLVAAAIGPLLIITGKAISGFKELLLNARKFTAFLSAHPALIAVAAMVGTYSAMDKSPEMQETLDERRGLGLNKSGRSAEIQALRDLKKRTTSSSATNSLAANKALDAAMSTAIAKPLVERTVTTPILDNIGGGSKTKSGGYFSGQSAAEKLVQGIRDQIKYLNADGAAFLPVLDEWKAKLKPLSDDWKTIVDLEKRITMDATEKAEEAVRKQAEQDKQAIKDLQSMMDGLSWQNSMGLMGDSEYLEHLTDMFAEMKAQLADPGIENWTELMKELFASIQQLQGDEAQEVLDNLRMQFESGSIGVEQYRSALEGLKNEFAEFPLVVKMLDDEIKGFDRSVQMSTKSIGVMIREAETALKDKLVGIPDELAGAFAGAIAYSEDLGESLKRLAKDIAYTTLKAFILKSLFGGIGGGGGGGVTEIANFTRNAQGNVFNQQGLVPFAQGGIVNKPTLFPFASGVGLMGEAGPEAIMPLKRTSSGDLGVKAEGGGGMTNITMNINAVDSQSFIQMLRNNKAAVESLVIENIYRNGSVRKAIQQGV